MYYENQCWKCLRGSGQRKKAGSYVEPCSTSERIERLRQGKCRYAVKGNLASHAFPGGYPLYYLGHDNAVLCPKCANKEALLSLVGRDINYEDSDLRCEECGKRIESAYAED